MINVILIQRIWQLRYSSAGSKHVFFRSSRVASLFFWFQVESQVNRLMEDKQQVQLKSKNFLWSQVTSTWLDFQVTNQVVVRYSFKMQLCESGHKWIALSFLSPLRLLGGTTDISSTPKTIALVFTYNWSKETTLDPANIHKLWTSNKMPMTW